MLRHAGVMGLFCLLVLSGCVFRKDYDAVIRNGMICDGSGSPPVAGSAAIRGDTIDAVGSSGWAKGRIEVDAKGMAVSPAGNLKLDRRGLPKKGCFADVVVFDPMTIQDHATYTQPQRYSTGVQHVFVNGVEVLRNGEHTGAKPGRVVRGPGYRKR